MCVCVCVCMRVNECESSECVRVREKTHSPSPESATTLSLTSVSGGGTFRREIQFKDGLQGWGRGKHILHFTIHWGESCIYKIPEDLAG